MDEKRTIIAGKRLKMTLSILLKKICFITMIYMYIYIIENKKPKYKNNLVIYISLKSPLIKFKFNVGILAGKKFTFFMK